MEVVVPGRAPGDIEHTGKCGRCGCVVKFKQKEARCIPGDRSWEPSTYGVNCPTQGCGGTIYSGSNNGNDLPYYMNR